MRVLAVILALAVTGCSFIMTSGPSDEKPRRSYPSCTSSKAWPVVDAVLAGLFVASMIGAISQDDDRSTSLDDDEASKAEKITSSAIFAALTGVSAYVGFQRVSSCKDARKEFYATNGYPGAYPYGQQPYPYGQQPYPQPYPGQAQQPYPQPQPATAPQPNQPQPPTGAQPTAIPSVLGTEGDVCASNDECAPGLACTSNVCKRPPAR